FGLSRRCGDLSPWRSIQRTGKGDSPVLFAAQSSVVRIQAFRQIESDFARADYRADRAAHAARSRVRAWFACRSQGDTSGLHRVVRVPRATFASADGRTLSLSVFCGLNGMGGSAISLTVRHTARGTKSA